MRHSGISFALPTRVNAKSRWIDGWRIRNWLDWCFAVISFIVFVALEGVIIYSYFVLLNLVH